MPERTLAGSRIRERRLAQGLKQAELAQDLGISASYLNLIEHNRRRIGGKLMQSLAAKLGVDAALLSEGAEQEVIARLSGIAARLGEEIGPAETADFAQRFPGWANLLIRSVRRIDELERNVETLTDRLTHDPHLAATLHEVLSTVTALRSTASILSETKEIEPEWRDRFHRNMSEDAARLAEGAEALVGFLDGAGDTQSDIGSPHEEALSLFEEHGWHFEALEAGGTGSVDLLLKDAPQIHSASAASIARGWLERYAEDAIAAPMQALEAALRSTGPDPLALGVALGVPPDLVMRRLAHVPNAGYGFVSCDASGTLLMRKPAAGFSIPRFGAACPLWPLFEALARPMVPLASTIAQPERSGGRGVGFEAYAIAQPQGSLEYGHAPLLEAAMLIVPLPAAEQDRPARPVGASCRICPRLGCAARREPSIMAGA